MEKILFVIIAATVFIIAAVSLTFISGDAITDAANFQQDAQQQQCQSRCAQLEEGEGSSYSAECYELHECPTLDENNVIEGEVNIPTE